MKKHLLLISLACIAITAIGQNSVPNGNFEAWNQVSYDYPQGYPYNSNYDVLYRYRSALPFNVVKTAAAQHGNSAVQITTVATVGDTAMAYFINANPNNGDPSSWTGGLPYNQTPTGITGYYKYNVATDDDALIFAVFSKGGVNIGTYIYPIGGYHTDYVPFNFTFDPPLSQTPDAVIFAATSSNIMINENGVAGSVLTLDNVSFTGVTSQPAAMNGDFETWETETMLSVSDWIMQSNYDQRGNENRTTDAVAGNYAIVLKSYLGENNGRPVARPEQVSTGYYPDNCNNDCHERGGYKYTQMKDTLTFWYKYAPANNEKALVYLNFKKNGNQIWWQNKDLVASTEYQYVEMPFNLWEAPDTVIVHIQSLRWEDSLVSAIGSVLTIDEVQFKSQPILYASMPAFAAKDQLSVFPNPSDGRFRISNESGIIQVTVYNMIGRKVYTKISAKREKLSEIDLTKFDKGVYFIEINDGAKTSTKKIVIQ
jgi:hypothetical protein